MSFDPGIVCFQHCGGKIFGLTLFEHCPACGEKLIDETAFRLLPFRLPYPFIRPSQYPCSIIIRPTIGDFLNDYYNSTDLHIGLTTSRGGIVEFDKCGLKRTFDKGVNGEWCQSLLVETVPDSWMDHWDDILAEISKKDVWIAKNYDEESNNCYSFVLEFLKALNYGELSKMAFSRTLFCEKYIVPRTTAAGKYISLYRKIRDNGHYIHPVDSGGGTANMLGKLCSIRE